MYIATSRHQAMVSSKDTSVHASSVDNFAAQGHRSITEVRVAADMAPLLLEPLPNANNSTKYITSVLPKPGSDFDVEISTHGIKRNHMVLVNSLISWKHEYPFDSPEYDLMKHLPTMTTQEMDSFSQNLDRVLIIVDEHTVATSDLDGAFTKILSSLTTEFTAMIPSLVVKICFPTTQTSSFTKSNSPLTKSSAHWVFLTALMEFIKSHKGRWTEVHFLIHGSEGMGRDAMTMFLTPIFSLRGNVDFWLRYEGVDGKYQTLAHDLRLQLRQNYLDIAAH